MISEGNSAWLVELSGVVWRLQCGWVIAFRFEWVDLDPWHPWGLDYALVLNDEHGHRILGFDNSHGFDGASSNDAFDHEHKDGYVGQRFKYEFQSPPKLLQDFLKRIEECCEVKGVAFEIVKE